MANVHTDAGVPGALTPRPHLRGIIGGFEVLSK